VTGERDFVGELAGFPGLVDQLLATHLDDGRGRCLGCAKTLSIRPSWPCGPREHARLAQERILARRQRRWITP
jgi:hypothetical protein